MVTHYNIWSINMTFNKKLMNQIICTHDIIITIAYNHKQKKMKIWVPKRSKCSHWVKVWNFIIW